MRRCSRVVWVSQPRPVEWRRGPSWLQAVSRRDDQQRTYHSRRRRRRRRRPSATAARVKGVVVDFDGSIQHSAALQLVKLTLRRCRSLRRKNNAQSATAITLCAITRALIPVLVVVTEETRVVAQRILSTRTLRWLLKKWLISVKTVPTIILERGPASHSQR